MDLRSIALIPVLSFALFQDPDTHSPTAKSTCTPGALNYRETRYERHRSDGLHHRLPIGRSLYVMVDQTAVMRSPDVYRKCF